MATALEATLFDSAASFSPRRWNTQPLSLKLLLERATAGQTMAQKTIDGRMLAVLTLKFPQATVEGDSAKTNAHEFTMEIHFDPSLNYLVRKVTYAQKNQTHYVVNEVQEFKEFKPGIFFPTKALLTYLNDGTKIEHF